ncbi:hypothetical protein ETJ91_25950 [Bacillus albus]|uniref:hypothetical protein n=1 Tax=Bacillus albus TaxID=2026189 RepID=UPI001009AD5A|nr:hypothetical protein [Bacillus albus]RXJ13401.1 hypothetical protein ETJ91_25950 [Bacillus albus]RXJ22776.1 hypothetical protein ETJ90_27680 [Bacillus albus]RXJ24951.1 hypothetical protein ETJ76_25345 [Bacillus albus]RXJ36360.1 hypothetical protein ETJ89_25590 [Bacillus albus]RXJ52070.1 hypothetical protein ETJ66_26455 [Bacillus albus]
MKINTVDAEGILKNEQVKEIIDIINENEPKLSKQKTGEINIYGVENDSSLGLDFLLNYKIKSKNFPGRDITLFSISAITIDEVWKFFVSSPNNEDILVENNQDFGGIIGNALQQKRVEELLGEIYGSAPSSYYKNEKNPKGNVAPLIKFKKQEITKKNHREDRNFGRDRIYETLPHYIRHGQSTVWPAANIMASLKKKGITLNITKDLPRNDLKVEECNLHTEEVQSEFYTPYRRVNNKRKKRSQRRRYHWSKVNVTNKKK